MDKKSKKILLIVGAAGVLVWLMIRKRESENTPDWANGVSKIGGAMVEVNKTLNEGLKTILNYSNRAERAAESYAEIDDHHAKSALYSTRNFF